MKARKQQALEELKEWCEKFDIDMWDDGDGIGVYIGQDCHLLSIKTITADNIQTELNRMREC